MKFTLSWLKDHLETKATLDEISRTLTMIGLEVEQIIDRAEALKSFAVAKILHAEQHPQADKLRVCRVQADVGELQIVCGAANARAGIYVALAKEGALIPANGMVIKKTKIRGVESNGMLCSATELGIGTDSEGIIELPESKIGESIVKVLGLDDPVIEIAITPNRADCLGVRGIARDLAAAGLGTLKPLPDLSKVKASFQPEIKITLQNPEKCPQFIGTTLRKLKNGPSPDWLRRRLEAIGQKPISALVDITNYLTIDLARPLHVYDAHKLSGNIHITVRDAMAGERLKALNGKEYALQPGICVIADDSGPLAIAGVIGGEDTGCTPETTDVLLEVALFDPAHVARTGRELQIDSDARYRFERGVDPDFAETGNKIALKMIMDICGGEMSEITIAGQPPEWKRTISFNPEHVKTLGGVNVPDNECDRILTALGFTGTTSVALPSWRADVEGEADLVEEVLRIHGYDNIPATPLPPLPGITKPALTLAQKRVQLAKRALAARGMLEAVTWSFLPEAQARLFGGDNPQLKLLNPISADLDTMRPSLLPNLLEAAKKNAFRGFKDASLFEVGLQFHDVTPDGQRMVATGVRTGIYTEHYYENLIMKRTQRYVDAYHAKADALAILETLGLNKADITTHTPPWYHPGRSGALTLGGKIILGYFGEIYPGLLPMYDLEGRVAAFEIFLDAIPVPRAKGKARPPFKPSDFQAVERDFAFIVEEKITAADIEKALKSADKNLITRVEIFDSYTGLGVDSGKKSVAVKVTLQAPDRTLSEANITAVSQAIVAAAAKGFGGQLRQ